MKIKPTGIHRARALVVAGQIRFFLERKRGATAYRPSIGHDQGDMDKEE